MEEKRDKVSFETIKAEIKDFGRNNFIEVARKKAIGEDGSTNEFISITRGYYLPDGSKRFKKSIAIPDDEEMRNFVADLVKEL